MNVVDLLISIVVVTILVTIILAVVTYVAYKLRLAREPAFRQEEGALRYFVTYDPQDAQSDGSARGQVRNDVAVLEGHASQA